MIVVRVTDKPGVNMVTQPCQESSHIGSLSCSAAIDSDYFTSLGSNYIAIHLGRFVRGQLPESEPIFEKQLILPCSRQLCIIFEVNTAVRIQVDVGIVYVLDPVV